MFEELIAEAASRLNLSAASLSALVRGLLGMMTDEHSGGVHGFVAMFRRAGLGDEITSWFGGREGRTLTPHQVESTLGPSALGRLAASTGLTRSAVSSATAFLLPKLIGLLTPGGILPSTKSLLAQVSQDIDRPAGVHPSRVERSDWPGWLAWASAAAALLALVSWLSLRGPAGTIDPQLNDVAGDEVRVANEKARAALGAIGTSGVSSPIEVVQAMNLAIINFPTGSAQIPASDLELIRQSAEALKRVPENSRIEIGGHTDNTGDAATNLTLSQQRADAVREALVSAGVPAAILTTRGYGDTKPRAQNDTEYGRFQNRRIEYAVVK
jgi:outer membrane protein OmpA-like peptidoglycan-associated protein/uncharacterized protein YidB (DUF937 family)